MKQAGHNHNTRNSNTRALGEVIKKYVVATFLPRMHCGPKASGSGQHSTSCLENIEH